MTTTIEESPFLTVEEIARYCRVSPPMVRYWIAAAGLPAYRVTGHYRIRQEHFLAWYEKHLKNDDR